MQYMTISIHYKYEKRLNPFFGLCEENQTENIITGYILDVWGLDSSEIDYFLNCLKIQFGSGRFISQKKNNHYYFFMPQGATESINIIEGMKNITGIAFNDYENISLQYDLRLIA